MENKEIANSNYLESEDEEVLNLISQPYKYGFTTKVETEEFPKGLNEEIIRLISNRKNEPSFMLEFRLRGYKIWCKMQSPEWACINYNDINYKAVRLL